MRKPIIFVSVVITLIGSHEHPHTHQEYVPIHAKPLYNMEVVATVSSQFTL